MLRKRFQAIRGSRSDMQIDLNAVIVQRQLEAHLNCSTDEKTKCTIEPGPKGDLGPPGPQGETGAQGPKGDRGEGLRKMYLIFCNWTQYCQYRHKHHLVSHAHCYYKVCDVSTVLHTVEIVLTFMIVC